MSKSAIVFASAEDMLNTINRGTDLYSPDLEMYVFSYNDFGSICVYDIDKDEAKELSRQAQEHDEYWGAFLGWGGGIIDEPDHPCYEDGRETPLDFCKEFYAAGEWYSTSDWC